MDFSVGNSIIYEHSTYIILKELILLGSNALISAN